MIKGNNLLALHSLKEQFAGKIKLIYIDPPYNTGNDGFNYNDSFNHSSWLVFMKNRLEIAKQLLSEDGSIYIQLDYNEVHYCKILMDEVFGRDNFQREIIWDMTVLSGYKTLAKNWIRGHETILFYSKSSNNLKFNKLTQPHTKEYEQMFNKTDKSGRKYMVAHGSTRYWDEVKDKGKPFGDVWNDVMSFQQQPTSSERMEFDGQKPEKLLERIIRSATDEGDVVLDFFGGTGTTASVAVKLQRQTIIIEQMDYMDTKLKKRLFDTVSGNHNSVLSKSVDWKGGGDFVYVELAKWNEEAKEKILKVKSLSELVKLFDELYER
ncbi:cytosine methyltransferase, partial [Candidatus Roizmanbacteria bacterium CG22_combo_CG10-13_8_21_14_all_33_16]